MNNENQRIIFNFPQETVFTEVVFDILKNNGLEESPREAYEKATTGKDSKLMIIRDAMVVLIQKKMSEGKLIELLQKHLEISNIVAEKVVRDIKEKLIAFSRIISTTNQQDELIRKLKINQEGTSEKAEKNTIIPTNIKKPLVVDVEKNAQNINEQGKNTVTEKRENFIQKPQENKTGELQKKADNYREPIQ